MLNWQLEKVLQKTTIEFEYLYMLTVRIYAYNSNMSQSE